MAGGRDLPSLRALAAFEAAGRHRSFSAAARELGVSQSAVSQQVAWLEAELGRPLFDRGHRGVKPTVDGAALLQAATGAFDAVEAAARSIRRPQAAVLQVATDFGFAAWWLMPRLAALNGRLPDVEVRVSTSQGDDGPRQAASDVLILFGRGPWPGCAARRITRERVMPVCSPAVLDRAGGVADPRALGRLRLLHLAGPAPARWLSWQDWFAHHGVRRDAQRDDLTFDSYQLVLQAALQGQGVALGWAPLIDGLVAEGRLAVLDGWALESERGYHLVIPGNRAPHPAVQQFCRWLLEECGEEVP